MKLLNREPTIKMISIAEGHDLGTYRFLSTLVVFQAMYDAAPEIKVYMEPIGCIDGMGGIIYSYEPKYNPMHKDDLLYSAEQVATLQADRDFWKLSFETANMAVQEEREELKNAYVERKAEHDELLAALKPILAISDRKHDAWDHVYALIAKHEGET